MVRLRTVVDCVPNLILIYTFCPFALFHRSQQVARVDRDTEMRTTNFFLKFRYNMVCIAFPTKLRTRRIPHIPRSLYRQGCVNCLCIFLDSLFKKRFFVANLSQKRPKTETRTHTQSFLKAKRERESPRTEMSYFVVVESLGMLLRRHVP